MISIQKYTFSERTWHKNLASTTDWLKNKLFWGITQNLIAPYCHEEVLLILPLRIDHTDFSRKWLNSLIVQTKEIINQMSSFIDMFIFFLLYEYSTKIMYKGLENINCTIKLKVTSVIYIINFLLKSRELFCYAEKMSTHKSP